MPPRSQPGLGGAHEDLTTRVLAAYRRAVELSRFATAAPDEVLRCEECRRILVRTAESGL